MPWCRQDSSNYIETIGLINDWLTLGFVAGTPSAGSNTGDGEVKGASANLDAVAETWTIAMTSATAFTVTGSVTGALATGTVNVPYVNDYICLSVVDGDTAFVSGDSWTVAITAVTSPWSAEREIAGNLTDTISEYIWKSTGGGSEEIYVGMQGVTDFTTYFNWSVNYFTGYNEDNDYDAQLGYYEKSFFMGSSGVHTIYMFKSAQHFSVVAILGTVNAHMTLGFIDPLGADAQWPYPIVALGNTTNDDATISGIGTSDTWWVGGGYLYCAAALNYNGANYTFNNEIWPIMDNIYRMNYIREYYFDTDQRELFPVMMIDNSERRFFGQVPGIFIPPNYDSSIGVSDTFIDGDLNIYLVIQNNAQSGSRNTAALRLD